MCIGLLLQIHRQEDSTLAIYHDNGARRQMPFGHDKNKESNIK